MPPTHSLSTRSSQRQVCRRALLLFFNGRVAAARDMGGGILLSELSSSLTRLNFLPGWSTAVWRTLPSSLPRSHWRLAGTYCTALLLPASVSPQPSNYFELCFLFWGCNKVFRCPIISWFQVVSQSVIHLFLQLGHLRVFQIYFSCSMVLLLGTNTKQLVIESVDTVLIFLF